MRGNFIFKKTGKNHHYENYHIYQAKLRYSLEFSVVIGKTKRDN